MDDHGYVQLTPASLRAHYVTLTDRLITVLEGADGWRPDDVIYLDKSGRPVAWLVKALWRLLAREPGTRYREGCYPRMPNVRFANIDREQWWHLTGASETGLVDVEKVPGEVVDELRSVFLAQRPLEGQRPRDVPSWFDHRSVLVVDEVSNTGDTLAIATGLVARAFPDADVRGDHWMTPGKTIDRHGLARVADVPTWYRSDTWAGRLVGNRLDPQNPSTTWRGTVGARFLSTRPRTPDERGRQLRREIARLAADVAAARLLAAPSSLRDPDDWAQRVFAIYGYDDPRAFTAARVEQATGH